MTRAGRIVSRQFNPRGGCFCFPSLREKRGVRAGRGGRGHVVGECEPGSCTLFVCHPENSGGRSLRSAAILRCSTTKAMYCSSFPWKATADDGRALGTNNLNALWLLGFVNKRIPRMLKNRGEGLLRSVVELSREVCLWGGGRAMLSCYNKFVRRDWTVNDQFIGPTERLTND